MLLLPAPLLQNDLNINVCHIEAGLRSNDMSMPEEVNRLVTDRISDLLLTPDRLSMRTSEGKEPPMQDQVCREYHD
jgi:UDP-N-acetylglucosamine 2-epimerase